MEEAEDEVFLKISGGIRQFVQVMGTEKCKGNLPTASRRVWFQRTATGSGTIYLFSLRPKQRVTTWYAEQAFGWIPEWPAQQIWLHAEQGWCNLWGRSSDEAHKLEGKPLSTFSQPSPLSEFNYIEFTDRIGAISAAHDEMRNLGLLTDHARQHQHWRTPAIVAQAVLAAPLLLTPEQVSSIQFKENSMASFDPYQAAAEQQTRLASSSKQGKSVNNLKQACGTALSNVATNNKSAAIDAGYLTAGTIANNQFTKLAGKHLPVLVRGYADTPFGKLVLANVAQMLVQHFKADNKAAQRLTEAMMTSAMAEVIGSTGIEELIDGFLSDPKIAKALKTADAE